MTTITDVAGRAGVSIATVSRILNNTAVVAQATRDRVLQAVDDLDYHPNQSARNLRRNQTGVILILTPNMTNPFYASILQGIGDTAAGLGFAALICNTGDDLKRSTAALDRLPRRQADGAIILSIDSDASWLQPYVDDFPIVQGAEFQSTVDIARVSIDNYSASRDIMDYLLGLGHTRIGHISAANGYRSTAARLDGYRDAIAEAGLTWQPEYVRKASPDYSFSSGKLAAQALLKMDPRPTALYCISDTLALGAVVAAQEMGLRVPGDVSVTGFDNVTETEMIRPHLTTLAQPCYELGCTATQILDDLMGHRPTALERVLEHRLVIRESSGPAPGAGSPAPQGTHKRLDGYRRPTRSDKEGDNS